MELVGKYAVQLHAYLNTDSELNQLNQVQKYYESLKMERPYHLRTA